MTISYENIRKSADAVRKSLKSEPQIGIILGTGLGGLSREIEEEEASVPFSDIPNFPQPTVETHTGRLVSGRLAGKSIVAMEGRFHFYEGWSLDQITLPVRMMRMLGAEILVVSNAAGGINPQLKRGDVVVIEDQINLMGVNPLVGPNDERLGVRFPDMSQPYSARLMELAEAVALENGIRVRTGVYAAMTGPCLETRAEYRMLKTLGADLIGMSTVPEVIAGVHAGFEILGLSVVTDMCLPDALEPAKIEDILEAANSAEPKLAAIVLGTVARL